MTKPDHVAGGVHVHHLWNEHDEPVGSLVLECGYELSHEALFKTGTLQLTIKKRS